MPHRGIVPDFWQTQGQFRNEVLSPFALHKEVRDPARLSLNELTMRKKERGFMTKLFLAAFLLLASGVAAEAQSCPGITGSPEWTECRKAVLSACAFVGTGQAAACESEVLQRRYLLTQQIAQQQRRGVSPASPWLCPMSHPIKGSLTTYSGERCIFHSPGGQFYDRTKAEICYATPADATADGCRVSLR
jgi:hypothetical protein